MTNFISATRRINPYAPVSALLVHAVVSAVLLFSIAITGPAVAGPAPLELVSSERGTSGQMAADGFSVGEAISADGRFVVFSSDAHDLVLGVTDPVSTWDLFVYDTLTGTSQLVSRSAANPAVPANQPTLGPATISGDGRHIAFTSSASDLVAGLTGTGSSVFLFDRVNGSMTLVSHTTGSPTTRGNGPSMNPIISRDGRFVAFESNASDLVADDGNGTKDVFLFDLNSGDVELVSRVVGTTETSANGESELGSISVDGAWVVFQSRAVNLANIIQDLNFERDVYLFDLATGENTLVSHAAGQPLTTSGNYAVDPQISGDGSWVVFQSRSTNIVTGQADANNGDDVFLYSRSTGTAVLASRSSGGAGTAGNARSFDPRISHDGRVVAFRSLATDLFSGQVDTNGDFDLFSFDRVALETTLVSHSAGSPTSTADDGTEDFALSGDGRSAAFSSRASNIVQGQVSVALPSVFLHHAGSGEAVLVSHAAGAPTIASNNVSWKPRLSRHGNLIFDSSSTDLGFTDSNGTGDVFVIRPVIFGNGFESGSSTAWSQTLP